MEYSRAKAKGQLFLEQPERFLHLPSALYGFRNTVTRTSLTRSGRNIICFEGEVDITAADRKCPCCGSLRMDSNGGQTIVLRHLPIGGTLSCVSFVHHQLQCRDCGVTKMQAIPFKAFRGIRFCRKAVCRCDRRTAVSLRNSGRWPPL